jgi:hypothetical protein
MPLMSIVKNVQIHFGADMREQIAAMMITIKFGKEKSDKTICRMERRLENDC